MPIAPAGENTEGRSGTLLAGSLSGTQSWRLGIEANVVHACGSGLRYGMTRQCQERAPGILAVASVHGGQLPDEGCASVEDELRGKCEAGDLSLGFWLDSARGWIRDGGRRRGWPDEDRAFGA